MRPIIYAAMAFTFVACPVLAQDLSVPPVTTADPGYLHPNDEIMRSTDPYLNPGPADNDARRPANAQRQQPSATPITMAQRQQAWSRHQAEYRRIMLQEGPAAADRWLDQQIMAGR